MQSNIPAELLQEELTRSLAEALCMDRSDVNVDDKFIDLGLDSIIGAEWIQTINKQYGTAIAASKVYDYPSIHEFAEFLEKELNKQGNQNPISPMTSVPSRNLSKNSLRPIELLSISSQTTPLVITGFAQRNGYQNGSSCS